MDCQSIDVAVAIWRKAGRTFCCWHEENTTGNLVCHVCCSRCLMDARPRDVVVMTRSRVVDTELLGMENAAAFGRAPFSLFVYLQQHKPPPVAEEEGGGGKKVNKREGERVLARFAGYNGAVGPSCPSIASRIASYQVAQQQQNFPIYSAQHVRPANTNTAHFDCTN